MSVTVFGSINMDIVMRVAHLPCPGETVMAESVDHLPGGKGANQATASARFGSVTRMIGAVGNDRFGDDMLALLKGAGVDVGSIARVADPTGIAHVFVSGEGENQIVVVPGANATAVASPWESPRGGIGREVALAQLESPAAEVARFLCEARAAGALAMLNAAPATQPALELLGEVDLLIVNETELALLLDRAPPEDRQSAIEAARALSRRPGQWIVVTLGAKGVIAVDGETVIEVPAPRVAAVDTTGAGDTFCGVLAAALSEGRVLEAAMRVAVVAASLSVQQRGAAASMPQRAEVEAALAG